MRPAWLLTPLALLVPVIGYLGLPMLGIHAFGQLFELKKLLLIATGLIGGALWLGWMRAVLPRPQWLVGFILLAWPPVDALNNWVMDAIGLNVHLRPLLLLTIGAPALWLLVKNARLLWDAIPWFRWYVAFFLWLTLYFVFNNANAMDTRLAGETSFFEGSVSVIQYTAYFYGLLAMAVAALAMLRLRNYRRLFDSLNAALLAISALEALLTVAGYPFGLFSMPLDGFTRALGIFTHPNPFAHHMGVLVIYLLGLLCYYQGERRGRVPGWLLLGGLGLNFVAFLLGLSKTALAAFACCSVLLLLMNLAVPAVRRAVPKLLLILLVLAPIGVFGFEALSGQSFFGLLEARIDQTQSLDWRTLIWQELLADFSPLSVLFGHGFTAANATVFQLSFHDAHDAQPLMMVHNAYIALLYDLGLPGYLMFAAIGALMVYAVRGWLKAASPALRTGYAMLLALALYFLFACGFDEMSYMFDAPMLFWALTGLLAGVQWRESRFPPTLTLPLQGGGDISFRTCEEKSPPPWRGRVRVGGKPPPGEHQP
jgi:O-antigen ligase